MKTRILIILVAAVLSIFQGYTSHGKEMHPGMFDGILPEYDGSTWSPENGRSDIKAAVNIAYIQGFFGASAFITTMIVYEMANSGIIPELSNVQNSCFQFLIFSEDENSDSLAGLLKDKFEEGEKLSTDLRNRYLYGNTDDIKDNFDLPDLNDTVLYSVKQSADIVNTFAMFDITVMQLKEGLDVFYKDFKNKQIRIHDAIYVVRKQIEGTLSSDIERLLVWLRQGKKDKELLNVRDRDGKIVRTITFP